MVCVVAGMETAGGVAVGGTESAAAGERSCSQGRVGEMDGEGRA